MVEICIISISNRQPDWINDGFINYAKRLKSGYKIQLLDIPILARSKNMNPKKKIEKEGQLMLKKIPDNAFVIALDILGEPLNTNQLAQDLRSWTEFKKIFFLIGGPDGLSKACLARANKIWSLSPLTFPHGLVRILVIESLYRAYSINLGHPYHRV
jgi:23S rRNA (pseudouridine1915-N3)-methyltransferase|tara:strand:+ start:8667 stop:9137 length:471 start_codon:yes stop_codon:yes gene_type:complete